MRQVVLAKLPYFIMQGMFQRSQNYILRYRVFDCGVFFFKLMVYSVPQSENKGSPKFSVILF